MATINNNKTSDINRGVDIILRRRKPKKKTKPLEISTLKRT